MEPKNSSADQYWKIPLVKDLFTISPTHPIVFVMLNAQQRYHRMYLFHTLSTKSTSLFKNHTSKTMVPVEISNCVYVCTMHCVFFSKCVLLIHILGLLTFCFHRLKFNFCLQLKILYYDPGVLEFFDSATFHTNSTT